MGDFLADDIRSFTLCTVWNINSACGRDVKTFHPAITAPVLLILLGCERPCILAPVLYHLTGCRLSRFRQWPCRLSSSKKCTNKCSFPCNKRRSFFLQFIAALSWVPCLHKLFLTVLSESGEDDYIYRLQAKFGLYR